MATDFEYRFDMKTAEDVIDGMADTRLMMFAEQVVKDAKEFCPVRTGQLRNSISYEKTKPLEIEIWAKAPYAYYVEFGTRYMKARAFLRPAIHINEKILNVTGSD